MKPGERLPADFRWRTELTAQGLSAADAVIAPTAAFAEAVAATYGLRDVPATVHNGRSPPVPTSQRTEAPARFVLASGRLWDEGKNIAALDRAAARIAAPVLAAGPLRAPHGGTVELRHARPLGALCEPVMQRCWPTLRSTRRSPSTSRSASACSKPPRPAARSSSPTSRPSASCGAAPPCSSRLTTMPPSPALDSVFGTTRSATDGATARERSTGTLSSAWPSAWPRTMAPARRELAGAFTQDLDGPRGRRKPRPRRRRGSRHEGRVFHPLPRLVLEPRQRPFPARRPARASPRGHEVEAFEPRDSWSRENLIAERGAAQADRRAKQVYPELKSPAFRRVAPWRIASSTPISCLCTSGTSPLSSPRIGDIRRRGARFKLLFHDTHHRAVSEPEAIRHFDLDAYDGVLAFGEALAQVYRRWGWGNRVFVWHEAADTRLFHPPLRRLRDRAWSGSAIGATASARRNWPNSCCEPAEAAGLRLDVHGVRYPAEALRMLDRHGARYQGWLPNTEAPAFRRHLATVHVPRRFYVNALPGIPTIRVFEALACGIPSSARPGATPRTSSRPARTSWSPATAPE